MFFLIFGPLFWLGQIAALLYLIYSLTQRQVPKGQFQLVMWAASTLDLVAATISFATAYLIVFSLIFAAIGLVRGARSVLGGAAFVAVLALWLVAFGLLSSRMIVLTLAVIQFILVSALFAFGGLVGRRKAAMEASHGSSNQ